MNKLLELSYEKLRNYNKASRSERDRMLDIRDATRKSGRANSKDLDRKIAKRHRGMRLANKKILAGVSSSKYYSNPLYGSRATRLAKIPAGGIREALAIAIVEDYLEEISQKRLGDYSLAMGARIKKLQKKFQKGTETGADDNEFRRRLSGYELARGKMAGTSRVAPSGHDRGVSMAMKKLRKEEYIDEISNTSMGGVAESDHTSRALYNKFRKERQEKRFARLHMLDNKERKERQKKRLASLRSRDPRSRITKEDMIHHLSAIMAEVSNKTLRSYIPKAATDIGMNMYSMGSDAKKNVRKRDPRARKVSNRIKGIDRASKKMAREDLIHALATSIVEDHMGLEPTAAGEYGFMKMHSVQKHLHPVAREAQFTSTTKKAKRRADKDSQNANTEDKNSTLAKLKRTRVRSGGADVGQV